jgi:hypothetical protein
MTAPAVIMFERSSKFSTQGSRGGQLSGRREGNLKRKAPPLKNSRVPDPIGVDLTAIRSIDHDFSKLPVRWEDPGRG